MKKVISLMLVLVLCISLLPTNSLAEEDTEAVVLDNEEASSDVTETTPENDLTEEITEGGEDVAFELKDEAPVNTDSSEELSSVQEIEELGTAYIYDTWINPAYKDLYEAGVLQLKAETQETGDLLLSGTRAAAYTSVEEAAAYVRGQMMLRNPSITFSIILFKRGVYKKHVLDLVPLPIIFIISFLNIS